LEELPYLLLDKPNLVFGLIFFSAKSMYFCYFSFFPNFGYQAFSLAFLSSYLGNSLTCYWISQIWFLVYYKSPSYLVTY